MTTDSTIWERLRDKLNRLHDEMALGATRPEVLSDKLSRRAQAFRQRSRETEDHGALLSGVAFTQGSSRYLLPVQNVREVAPLEQISPVPGSPKWIRGVVQCRGEILALLDLGRLFQVPETGLADLHMGLVVQAADRVVAVAATTIEDVINVPSRQLAAPPEFGERFPANWIAGVYHGDRLVLRIEEILSDERLTNWIDD
ncbi:chemotaxis protein CheW [Planctomicrobium sp. SH664]|uniref:chemotaxis protein CheW n=1 Tax=Planctomicrobium sp. SH664 TaxID=3448125 RepID=UPI003F5B62BD